MPQPASISLLLLIDGYNVVAPVAPPAGGATADWLQRERRQLIDRLARGLDDSVRARTCVVFDAAHPPPDRPSQFQVEGIDIRFAVDQPEADDLIENLIAAHSAPKQLAVVSSDHRIQAAARRRGALAFNAQSWLDDLLDGRIGLAAPRSARAGQGGADPPPQKPAETIDRQEVEQWMKEFGFEPRQD